MVRFCVKFVIFNNKKGKIPLQTCLQPKRSFLRLHFHNLHHKRVGFPSRKRRHHPQSLLHLRKRRENQFRRLHVIIRDHNLRAAAHRVIHKQLLQLLKELAQVCISLLRLLLKASLLPLHKLHYILVKRAGGIHSR